MTIAHFILFVTAMVYTVIGYNTWEIFGTEVYYNSVAFCIFSLILIIHSQTRQRFQRDTTLFFLFLSAGNLYDEFKGDPLGQHLAEYISTCLFLIYILLRRPIKRTIFGLLSQIRRKINLKLKK